MKENFSKRVQFIIKNAKEEAVRLGHSYVGSEHLLLGMIRLDSGLAIKIFDIYDCNLVDLKTMIEDMIKSSGGTMTLGHLPLTRRAERILRNAYNEAAALGVSVADDEHILLAMLKETEGIAFEVLNSYNLDYDGVIELLKDEATNENDPDDEEDNENPIPIIHKEKISRKSKTPALDHFSRDITEMATKNKLDPVIGRVEEIERVAQVLTRRKKNNPVLIGEPGVGKTAIIEGLAQRIIEKSVPRLLHNKRILSLDLAAIVAGTKYRGQFEERMKTIMVELENTENLILFIDEIHTLVGAGGASGSLDASNMFKPALARGDIHCIGATTLDEYRKYIEKDGALERRFQKIIVNPPNQEATIQILIGLKNVYEKHHNVIYDLDAIKACVYLSDRYISEKYLPDKAIDIMDEAGSRAHLKNISVPQEILDLEKEIDKIRANKEEVVAAQKFEAAAEFRDKEQKLLAKLSKAQQNWKDTENAKPVLITEDTIADVVSLVSGIPVNKVAESESNKLLKMSAELQNSIVGQEQAIESISRSIQRARAGLKDPKRPIGVFLFLGPTGVGKTELAKVLANYLFSHDGSLIKIDMSEFGERFSVSRLIGAPPGYVGYEEGGELTEKVRRNPYSVILFDEMEKAHPDVFNLLLQLFDEGVLTDSFSRKVDFKNTIIIMTSNIGTKELEKNNTLGFTEQTIDSTYESMKIKLLEKIKTVFNPEFINRIDETIVFHPLNEIHILKIIDLQLLDLRKNLERKGIKIKLSKSAIDLLVKNGFDSKFGARHLRREIQKSLENPISEMLLEDKFSFGDTIHVKANKGVYFYNKTKTGKKQSSTL